MPDSLESKLARMEAMVEAAQRAVDMFGPTAGQVLKLDGRMETALRELSDFRDWIGDVENRIGKRLDGLATDVKDLREDFREYDKQRQEARTRIALAVIAGSFTVIAAIVAATAAIITGA